MTDSPDSKPSASDGPRKDRETPSPVQIGPTIPAPEPEHPGFWGRLRRRVIGAPRDIYDPKLFHKVSLIAILAWIGFGSDGISSSAYGPAEAWKVLYADHATYLGFALVLATALTVFIISYTYSRIIEHFPHGGGGYVVATKLLGPYFGVASGCALLVDYVLTVTVSVAAGSDAIFSVLPPSWNAWKLSLDFAAIGVLIVLNIRGIKESIVTLAPIFLVFILTHVALIAWGITAYGHAIVPEAIRVHREVSSGLKRVGAFVLFSFFVRAYTMGGGTYTGIEAVSNGVQAMREPRVRTAKRTMLLMAISLAFIAGGIMFCYILIQARPELTANGTEIRTLNEILASAVAGRWAIGGLHVGRGFVIIALTSEAALLFVAAQTGFLDGPRVMSNMALDSWMPHRFSSLSDRLTMRNGVVVMGTAAIAVLVYTKGDVTALVIMYSINVFITFSLSNLGMSRFWVQERKRQGEWKRHLAVHVVGLILCLTILVGTIVMKFSEGGWLTLVITAVVIALCLLIKKHYDGVYANVGRLDAALDDLPADPTVKTPEIDPKQPTAALFVSRYGGLGKHALLNVGSYFRGHFKNVVFLSIGVIDSGSFKGAAEVNDLREHTREELDRYVKLAHNLGFAAKAEMAVGTDVIDEAEKLCRQIARELPGVIFFSGKLIFERQRWWERFLHNETAIQIQRRIQFAGLPMVILPVRVLSERAPAGRKR